MLLKNLKNMFEDLKPQSNKVLEANSHAEVSDGNALPLVERSENRKKEENGDGGNLENKELVEKGEETKITAPVDIFSNIAENKNKPFLKQVDKSKKQIVDKDEINNGNKKRFKFIGVSFGIVAFIVIVFLSINIFEGFSLNKMFSTEEVVNKENIEDTDSKEVTDDIDETKELEIESSAPVYAENQETSQEENLELKIDSDGDGLTDEDEEKLGTAPLKADTDADNLSDREEIMVYKTDPLNPDSDGDGYLDGAEVSAGYNPKGEGKLIKISNSPNF